MQILKNKKINFNISYESKTLKKNILKVLKKKEYIDGYFQNLCEKKISQIIKAKNVILTQSCTSALEAAISVCEIKSGDEVIIPSYTFTSTANCILLKGAKPVFADIDPVTLNLNPVDVEKKITRKTKAIIVVHYAGFSCEMSKFLHLKNKYKIFLIEDAAHAFLGKYNNKFLGTIGDLGAYSFHQTKNFPSGQGGALVINNKKLISKSKMFCDKGTDRNINSKKSYYSWKFCGSEVRATEITAAMICSQIASKNYVQKRRKVIWNFYHKNLSNIKQNLFYILSKNKIFNDGSYHVFPIIFYDKKNKEKFIKYMNSKNIECYFHYYPLHMSSLGRKISKFTLPETEKVYDGLVRLPLYPNLEEKQILRILKEIGLFIKVFNL